MRDVDSFVRNQVRKILLEESDPEPASPENASDKGEKSREATIVRGRVGRGNFSKAAKAAGSLAEKDPKTLIEKLKLKGASGKSDLEKVLSIVKQAISGAEVMRDAYDKAEILQDETGARFIRVAHNPDLSPREAAQYMYLTFIAAKKVGLLAGIQGQITPGLIRVSGGETVAILLL